MDGTIDTATLHGHGGSRLAWEALPAAVRGAVRDGLGAPVVSARTQPGGFSPGMAARLTLADGRRVFAKATSADPNPDTLAFYRREAAVNAVLPAAAPAPRLLWCHDDGGWIVLVFDDVDGSPPALPWRPAERDRLLHALTGFAADLTPAPPEAAALVGTFADGMAPTLGTWRALAADPPAALEGLDGWAFRHVAELADREDGWPDAAAGDTLLHGDTRADNVLFTPDRVVLVDWPAACVGAAMLDLLCLLPSMIMQGVPDPERIVAGHPLTRDADPAAVTTLLAAIAGYFVGQALLPPPPGLHRVRAFQRAQGLATLGWLRHRMG